MELSFKKHVLSEGEKVWLSEIVKSDLIDVRVAKVKLYDKLPKDFDPGKIDPRLYANNRITLIGLWHIKPNDSIFQLIDRIIQYVRGKIYERPGIEEFTASSIAKEIGVNEDEVARALYALSYLGGFISSATGPDMYRYHTIRLEGEKSYDAYLNYQGIEDALERAYVERDPGKRRKANERVTFPGYSDEEPSAHGKAVETVSVKRNSAFVLMAIDPSKPELEDVYNTIKDVCREFGVEAYRADEIHHQDKITDRILEEIKTCEYLIADLTFERPNVYYEVGYAHALNKKPILYRKNGTKLHFDLAVHNVPEYENITELKKKLKSRFEAIMGRNSKP